MLTAYPKFLHSSLAKRIMTSYEFFRDLFQSDEKVIKAVKRSPDILISVEKNVAPNIAILSEHGVPEFHIAKLMQSWARSVILTPRDFFRKVVEKVVDMGFDALELCFLAAVHVIR